MHISKLQLVNYRNFARTNVTFKGGVNTIIGENGSGKTNLFSSAPFACCSTAISHGQPAA
jgi:recombinational DNA repair ATPase RecF